MCVQRSHPAASVARQNRCLLFLFLCELNSRETVAYGCAVSRGPPDCKQGCECYRNDQCVCSALSLSVCLVFAACKKNPQVVAPAAQEVAKATPAPSATPIPEPVDLKSQVIVLCYHRFEDKPKDSLAIKPTDFEAQMQALKDNGITVISMADFLAWRRGEKGIPEKSAIISIDDGYLSGYNVAWPILKKFGYPFTMFIYTDYIKGGPKSGGQSISWDQLAEMRDAGVDIESHTVSHSSLNARKGKTDGAVSRLAEKRNRRFKGNSREEPWHSDQGVRVSLWTP